MQRPYQKQHLSETKNESETASAVDSAYPSFIHQEFMTAAVTPTVIGFSFYLAGYE